MPVPSKVPTSNQGMIPTKFIENQDSVFSAGESLVRFQDKIPFPANVPMTSLSLHLAAFSP